MFLFVFQYTDYTLQIPFTWTNVFVAVGNTPLTLSTHVRPAIDLDSIIFSSHGLILILDTGMFA